MPTFSGNFNGRTAFGLERLQDGFLTGEVGMIVRRYARYAEERLAPPLFGLLPETASDLRWQPASQVPGFRRRSFALYALSQRPEVPRFCFSQSVSPLHSEVKENPLPLIGL